MRIDILRFLAMPEADRQAKAKGESKGDSGDIITPIDSSGYGQWKHIKNSRGWPWDLRLYDKHYVYDWITEGANGWSDDLEVGPKSFKKFIGNHYGGKGLNDGLPMFPRYIDTIDNNSVLRIPPDMTMYAVFEGCQMVEEAHSLGDITQRLHGPFLINHGGDIGNRPTLIHQYYWVDNGTPVLEENYYALDRGWVAWKLQSFDHATGLYQLTSETVEVNVYPVPEVKVVFPCF